MQKLLLPLLLCICCREYFSSTISSPKKYLVRGGSNDKNIDVGGSEDSIFEPYSNLSPIDGSEISILLTNEPKIKPNKETLLWGHTFTDHMLEIDWDDEHGWYPPRIVPFQNFSLSPAASVFHYGIEVFEGLKAYRSYDNESLMLFRPEKNMERLNSSLKRLLMPTIDEKEFLSLIKKLVEIDESWIPEGEGYSLYLRPTAISTYDSIGVAPTKRIKLYVIASPCGPYYKEGFKSVKLLANTHYTRAWPGGVGYTKSGGNYAPTILPAAEAKIKGYAQVLWLYGPDHLVTEVGAMNIFFLLDNPDSPGKLELVTPSLHRKDILPGVTRDSVIELAKEWGDVQVSERDISMNEIKLASEESRLIEAFATGTAAVISPISCIAYEDIELYTKECMGMGPFAKKVWDALADIQYGRIVHKWQTRIKLSNAADYNGNSKEN